MALSRKEQQDALDKAKNFVESVQESHAANQRLWRQRSDAYHAVLDVQKDRHAWMTRRGAPYVMHIVDSTLASMVEDKLRFRIRPRAQMWELEDDPAQAMKLAKAGAEAHQILFEWQNRQTKFTRLQRPFLLQNAITGITVAKTWWTEQVERRRRMVARQEPLLDEYDEPIIDPISGQPVMTTRLAEETKAITVYDGPITEVVDVNDFYWPKQARSLDGARFVAHRIWLSREEVEERFKEGGPYGPDNGGWTAKKLWQELGDTRSNPDTFGARWNEKGESTHDWDNLEIHEVWDNHEKMVTTIINRSGLLAHKKFPFFHEKPPFTVCTTQPGLFSVVGISQVEKVDALQSALWELTAQREANMKLVNNAIVIFNPAMEDADALEFFPGAMWPMEDPELVQMWTPNVIPAELSLGSESVLKGDMQNLASTFPFSSGAESQTVDQKTATGASIVSALAQRSIDMAKQPVYDAWEDIGDQRIVLNNQFIREPTTATVLGLDNEEQVQIILPELLAGDYEYEQEAIPDALMQQQEQGKATAMMTAFQQLAPILLPLSQAGAAPMVDFEAVIEYYLKAMGIEDTKAFFIRKPPENVALDQQGSAPAGGGDALGITAGPGGMEPGSQMADSPAVNLQRAGAMTGGGRNA